MNYTSSQKKAIEFRNRNMAVSAAAGSGKTATLTRRIISLLTDPQDPAQIDRMLVVTFTRAAAGELKERIAAALADAISQGTGNENEKLSGQLTSLGSASICTIDSYCLELIRNNFQRLGLPASFRMADDAELAVLRHEIMDEVIEKHFASDDVFVLLSETVTGERNDQSLADILLKLNQHLMSLPEGIGYLLKCAEEYEREIGNDFSSSRAWKVIAEAETVPLTNVRRMLTDLIAEIDADGELEKDRQYAEERISYTDDLLRAFDARDTEQIMALKKSRFKKNGISIKSLSQNFPQHAALKSSISSVFSDWKKDHFHMEETDVKETLKITAGFVRCLYSVFSDFYEAYTAEKLSRSVLEFNDLKRYALQILVGPDGEPTPAALTERERFTHIFVDEYQDTDIVQDKIFRTISRGDNLFIVGDVKQSIYRFRGAEPSIFTAYRSEYAPAPAADDGSGLPCSVFMSDNFRCSEPIVTFTNTVCSYLFRESERDGAAVGRIGYVPEDDLKFSRVGASSAEPVRIVLLEKPDVPRNASGTEDGNGGNDVDADDSGSVDGNGAGNIPSVQAKYIAEEISRLLQSGRKPDGTPILPGDIAVLSRKGVQVKEICDALAHTGLPFKNADESDPLENPEVLLMLCLLSAADNPQRDIPLAGALRSPIFGFTLSDLVNIRVGRQQGSLFDALNECAAADAAVSPELKSRCRAAAERLEKYRAEAEAMPVNRFIRFLWRDVGAQTYAGTDPESARRSAAERRRNLRRFYDYARSFEASSFRSVHDFVTYINEMIAEKARISSDQRSLGDAVQVMTIHKSKGLEFPVVFLVSANVDFSNKSISCNPVFTTAEHFGPAFELNVGDGLKKLKTPMSVAAKQRIKQLERAEEIRILYVALTRARDMLYITGENTPAKLDKLFENAENLALSGGIDAIIKSHNYMEMLLTALNGQTERPFCTLERIPAIPVVDDAVPETEETLFTGDGTEYDDELKRRFSFRYPFLENTQIPAKLSVSRLYPGVLEGSDDADAEDTDFLRQAEQLGARTPRVPRFMGGEPGGAAERGTATHLFLQFCDFSRLDGSAGSVKREADRMTAAGFLPPDTTALIRVGELAAFSSGEFFASLRRARRIFREQRFNIFLSADSFALSEEKKAALRGEKLMVQGVIDLFFEDENGDLILCDYKTDRLTREELNDPEAARDRMERVHGEQLGYYAAAVELMTGRRPDRICIYSLHMGRELDISVGGTGAYEGVV